MIIKCNQPSIVFFLFAGIRWAGLKIKKIDACLFGSNPFILNQDGDPYPGIPY